ncbi:MAG: RNA-binding protein hfq [Rhodobiaceae bacterium]|nr:RNA-binding protein hfq [Rhodobiaceae bacterium]|tara:strand:- start:843 stop:1061 length:219 start_codon:yes stop_codon:yes gene_type:complete
MLDTTKENATELDEENFIKDLIIHCKLVTIFLISGIKLEGTITSSDINTITLKGSNNTQLIYKHAVSTILPV